MSERRPSTDDPQRLAALHALALLDTPPEERFDRIARTAGRLLDAPVSFISLIDANRQWFKSCIGLGFTETPIAVSFCAHALAGDPLVIQDAASDERFRDNPLVVEPPYLRAYAGQPLRAPDGRVVGTLCVMDFKPRAWSPNDAAMLTDLSSWAEREFASADLANLASELQVSESGMRAIMESVDEGIVVLGEDGETRFTNAAAERIVGQPPGSLLGSDFHATVHHSHPDGTPYPFEDCGVRQTLRDGTTLRARPEVFWRADGSQIPVELSCAPLAADGAVGGAVIVFRDVSERRELEQMKDQFVSSVSHELRTPLTAIKGYLEGLLAEEVGPLTDEQREDLKIVARNAGRLHTLIDDLLLLSRIEGRRTELARRTMDIASLVLELVDDLRPNTARLGQTIDLDVPDRLEVVGDAHRLRQVFANLLSNALKFNRPGGRVTIRGLDDGRSVLVEVSDEGVGIPADELDRLTQRFFRASTAGTVEGTGLGLAITREIVERHGGELEIQSTEGVGSTFAVRLPRML